MLCVCIQRNNDLHLHILVLVKLYRRPTHLGDGIFLMLIIYFGIIYSQSIFKHELPDPLQLYSKGGKTTRNNITLPRGTKNLARHHLGRRTFVNILKKYSQQEKEMKPTSSWLTFDGGFFFFIKKKF